MEGALNTSDESRWGNSAVDEAPSTSSISDPPHWTSPTLPASMRRPNGWNVSQFKVCEQIHKGSVSQVQVAIDSLSGAVVALKMYSKRKLGVLSRHQVEREIALQLQLDHENIIRLFAAFEDDQGVYLVQELARGGDLFQKLKGRGKDQPDEAKIAQDFIFPFLCALKYIHSKGILHRDIKPENIILTADGVLKLADFGLAINAHHERPVTRAGTLQYMAPEVLVCPEKTRPDENKDRKELSYSTQVDIWAAGILVYELLIGHTPFGKEARQLSPEYVMNVIDKEPEFPFWLSKDAKSFIKTALSKNSDSRPTAKQLLKHPWIRLHCGKRRTTLSGRSDDGPSSSNAGSPEPPSPSDHSRQPGPGRHPRTGVLSDDSTLTQLCGRALSQAACQHLMAHGAGGSPSLMRNLSMPFEAGVAKGSPESLKRDPASAHDPCGRGPSPSPSPLCSSRSPASPAAREHGGLETSARGHSRAGCTGQEPGRHNLTHLVHTMVRGSLGAPLPSGPALPSPPLHATRDRDEHPARGAALSGARDRDEGLVSPAGGSSCSRGQGGSARLRAGILTSRSASITSSTNPRLYTARNCVSDAASGASGSLHRTVHKSSPASPWESGVGMGVTGSLGKTTGGSWTRPPSCASSAPGFRLVGGGDSATGKVRSGSSRTERRA